MKKIQGLLPWIMPLGALLAGGVMYMLEQKMGWFGGWIYILMAAVYYVLYVAMGKCLVDLRALLSLSWLGGVGLASFRLSKMHTPWSNATWISFIGFYVVCMLVYELLELFLTKKRVSKTTVQSEERKQLIEKRLYQLIFITAGVSFGCFALEVLKLRYIPLFADFTHAYNYFHVTGLHYFTFSSMMVHAVTTLFLGYRGVKNLTKKETIRIIAANLLAISIPILCISKLQFLLIFFLPAFIVLRFLHFERLSDLPWKKILVIGVIILAVGVGAGVLFTARRNYQPGYLNGIFEMRDENMAMMPQYLYMYTSHNFANYNYLTENITEYSHGLRQAFPLFALTGLKFLFPDVTRFESYLIKPELSTLTIIYDAFFDFGLAGVFAFAVILGAVLCALTHLCLQRREHNPMALLLYCQFAVYMLLSFFDTWFSNPTTWFWMAITVVMYWFVGRKGKIEKIQK